MFNVDSLFMKVSKLNKTQVSVWVMLQGNSQNWRSFEFNGFFSLQI